MPPSFPAIGHWQRPRSRCQTSRFTRAGIRAGPDGREARTDPTVLRVLPVVVLRNEGRLDWEDVRSRARRAKLKAELGMLLDLTAAVSGRASLHEQTHGLSDRRRRVPRYLPEPASDFERRLADKRTPPAARRWGFRMNMSEASVGEFVRRHVA